MDRHIHRAVTKLSVLYILKWCAWNDVVRQTTSSVATQVASDRAMWPDPVIRFQPSQLMHRNAIPSAFYCPCYTTIST